MSAEVFSSAVSAVRAVGTAVDSDAVVSAEADYDTADSCTASADTADSGTAEGADRDKGLDTEADSEAVFEVLAEMDSAVSEADSAVSVRRNSACTVLLFRAEYKLSLCSDYPYYLIFFCLTYYAPFRKACSLFIQQTAGFFLFQSPDINRSAGHRRTYQIIYHHCRC